MVFNRRRRAKVKWEKQITKARKDTKDQFDRMVHDQPSAVSDLSQTVYTNGSEVDAIGEFGKNTAYGMADSFTLGNPTAEFEPIGDYDPIDGGVDQRGAYNIDQFAEDDTFDNTFDSQGRGSNIFPTSTNGSEITGSQGRGSNIFPTSTNGSGFQGDAWGNQGSYRVQGLETGSDVVGASGIGSSSFQSALKNPRRRRSKKVSKNQTLGTFTDIDHDDESEGEDDDSKYKSKYTKGYFDDEYDIPQPIRQSPIMILYDTILSHPILTCISLPCIPCLAVYVKNSERNVSVAPKRRIRKKGKKRAEDDSTFAEYNANKKRFDEISKDESRSDMNTRRSGKPNSPSKHKGRMRSFASKNSEFSALNSQIRGRRPRSRGGTAEFSQIQSRGRPHSRGMDSRGMLSQGMTNEFSNIASQHPLSDSNFQSGASYDPRGAYDNVGNHYSLTMDGNDENQFIQTVPQGEWKGASIDETPTMYSGNQSVGSRSVGWKLDEVSSRGNPGQASFDDTEVNHGFWRKASETFSVKLGKNRSNESFRKDGGWNNNVADSFSQHGHGINNRNDNDTYGSSTCGDGSERYY